MKLCPRPVWTKLRRENLYRFVNHTFHVNARFWTKAQYAMWNDHYDNTQLDSYVTLLRIIWIANCFITLFSMFNKSYDVRHKALTLNQETRRMVEADFCPRGIVILD
jgi:hypothetical protein